MLDTVNLAILNKWEIRRQHYSVIILLLPSHVMQNGGVAVLSLVILGRNVRNKMTMKKKHKEVVAGDHYSNHKLNKVTSFSISPTLFFLIFFSCPFFKWY